MYFIFVLVLGRGMRFSPVIGSSADLRVRCLLRQRIVSQEDKRPSFVDAMLLVFIHNSLVKSPHAAEYRYRERGELGGHNLLLRSYINVPSCKDLS